MFESLLLLGVLWMLFRGRWQRGGADRLQGILASAETAGIITTEQRARLLVHAAEHSAPRRLGAAWLAIVAGLFVAAGVSLLIARNWELIGPAARVGAFLLALAALGAAAIRHREGSVAVAVPLELLWFILPLLGIGLYGQTFQLSGDAIRPFLAWLALTAPLAWLSARRVIASLHTAALVAVLFVGNFVANPMSWLLAAGGPAPGNALALTGGTPTASAWLLSLVLLVAIALQSLRLLPRGHRHHFLGVAAAWIFGLLVACEPLRLEHPAFLILAAAALTTLWLALQTALDTSVAERRTSAVAWLSAPYGLTFLWHARSAFHGDTTTGGVILVFVMAVAALVAVLALMPTRLSPSPSWARVAKLVLLVPLAAAVVILGERVELLWVVAVAMNLFLVVVAVALMWHGSLFHEIAHVNLGVLVLVGMLVTRFLDVFGDMLQSGVGFIVAGFGLAGLAYALERTRRRLIQVPQGVAQ